MGRSLVVFLLLWASCAGMMCWFQYSTKALKVTVLWNIFKGLFCATIAVAICVIIVLLF